MKKIIQEMKKWQLLTAALFLIHTVGFAQLSGNYTIDSASATAGTNYQTFAAAVTALTTSGVNGAVTFSVKKGTYVEKVTIPAITGASASNTITFKGLGQDTKVQYNTLSAISIFTINGADYITIDSLYINNLNSNGRGVFFTNQADYNTVQNCYITGGGTSNAWGIYARATATAAAKYGNNANYLTLKNNTFNNHWISIILYGDPIAKTNGHIIEGNTLEKIVLRGIQLEGINSIDILKNQLIGAPTNHDKKGIYTLDCGSTSGTLLIANNFMYFSGFNTKQVNGIQIHNNSKYVNVYNNNVRIMTGNSSSQTLYVASSASNIDIKSNHFVTEKAGQYSMNIVPTSSTITANYNNHYSTISPNFKVRWGSSTYTNLASYKTGKTPNGANAQNADPMFVSATDLHVTSVALNNSGVVIAGITDDIDGDIRNLTTPDIGADEYTPPSCLPTTNVGSFNVVSTTASIYFTQSNTGSSFKIEYDTTGFALGSGITITSLNDTVVLTGLTTQTTYDVYVKEICSATDSSAWSTVYSFTTPCATISTFPYTETFDGSTWVSGTGSANTGDVIDPCWTKTPVSGFVYRWGTRTGSTGSSSTGPTAGYGGSGKYIFTEGSYGSAGATPTFSSPTYDLSSLTSPQLTFQYHMYGSSMGTMMLLVWNGSANDTVWTKTGPQGNQWIEEIIDLSAYTTNATHLTFVAKKGSSYSNDMAIDDIIIEEAPTCPKPTAVFLNNATSNSFDINFTSSGTTFIIEYGPSGFAQGTGMIDTAYATGHTIGGLAGETWYDAYIQNDCTDSAKGVSTWAGPFTIKTLCSEITGTYQNNWDQLSQYESDYCWSLLKFGPGGAPLARAYKPSTFAALQPKSPLNYYQYYNSSNHDNYLVGPAFTYLDSNKLQIRMQVAATYFGTKSPKLEIGTMLTATDTSSYTAITTISPTKDVWNEFIIALTNVPAGHKYIVLRNTTVGNYVYVVLDDFYVEYIPACVPPSNGTTSNITANSAVISWVMGGDSVYNVEYGVSGYTQGTGTKIMGLTTNTDTLTGLTSQTCYDVYVQTACNLINSQWYGPFTFCTLCGTVTAPYIENFDNANWVSGVSFSNANDLIDYCWSRNPSATSTFKWGTRTGSSPSSSTGPSADVSGTGKYIYTEASYGITGNIAEIITPVVDFSALTKPTLSFSYHMYGATMGGIYVTIWDSTQYDTIFVVSGQQHTSTTAAWTKVYIDLSAYKANASSIRILGKKGSSFSGDMAIDELSIAELPSCLPPTAFTLDSVNSTFAAFSWSTLTNNTAFKLEYGPTGFTQGTGQGIVVNANTNPYTLSGLTVNTTYDIYLADACDTTVWLGPITFTTLIDNDAELTSVVSPFAGDCGDSSYVVEVQIRNNGLNSISSLPINVNISGAASGTLSTTFTGGIAPGATATINVGTFNSYNGGYINVMAFSALTGDQNTTNDTLAIDSVEIISAMPMYMPTDTLCKGDTTGMFVAIPQTGITYNWYNNATDTVPMATGDTLKVNPGDTKYLDRSKNSSLEIQDGNTGSLFGTMFKIYVKQDFEFTGYSWQSAWGGVKHLKAFYRKGTYRGHETNRADWILIDTMQVYGTSDKKDYRFDFANTVTFTAGDTISIYLASKTGKYKAEGLASKGAVLDSVFKVTTDFDYIAGIGGAYFGSNLVTANSASSIVNTLHWKSLDVCGNNRVALTMGLNTDTAVATFTHVLDPNGADVTFDASAASGHTFDWNFGDGNMGTGTNPMHTYGAAGAYNVTLLVTDTVCGTTDSMTVTINATVSLSETLLGRTLTVYPNPNSGAFRVSFEMEGVKDVDLAVTDELGRIVFTQSLGKISGVYKSSLNLEGMAEGMYILRISIDGESTFKKISIVK